MSRLDQHVAAVQNKLAIGKFFDALARSAALFALAVWMAILVDRFFWVRLPREKIWMAVGAGLAALTAMGYAIWRRPSEMDAAVRIDAALQTKDKFATALHVRTMSDPFAHAALLDAERSADAVSLHKRFPISIPRFAIVPLIIGVVALCTHLWLKPLDLFGKQAAAIKQNEQTAKVEQAKKRVNEAAVMVASVPKALQDDPALKLAKETLDQQLKQGISDPERAQRTAAKALQDVNEAIKEQIKTNAKFAQAQDDAKMLKHIQVPSDEKGPVADAQRELAKGNFDEALKELNKAVENFDTMDKKDKDKAAEQMKRMANQLQQMANNPDQQKQMQQAMQQMGMNPQQAQQAQQLLQQAAQGNKQAQQQLQQMAQQLQKQMNNGQGPTPQQAQQIQQMMQQMQAQANGQQQAQQMAQAAQQMAQAMQQANPQQPGQQQMSKAAQQMQQQIQQMQAQQADAKQIAAAQQQAQNAAAQAMGECNNPGQNGNKPGGGNADGQWNNNGNIAGDPNQQNQPWNGQPGAKNGNAPNKGGQGIGDRSGKSQAPYTVKPEVSPSQDDEKGRILASSLVKASALKGESKETLKEVAENAQKDAADEIDQDVVSRQAQRVVRDYFGSMQKDAETTSPTTAPSN